ncbi:hypothetical protein EVG20_g2840 [Dentipellis fragilis]|uniref:Uncharacterized protein n=1 Tax=Dentipellis fragilis TaxID=205917 RepID=A0A4Y9Z7P9_9AGAM|nr:hypothetical protein EVG20_g2840 [Dentipellis fragilis]
MAIISTAQNTVLSFVTFQDRSPMAHLTASPFHKPSAFEVARAAQLPTPPDTDTDFAGLGQPHGAPAEGESWGLPSGPADGRHHRVSTLQYRNTGFRERDRTSTRQSKWLVVVLPPPSVAERHGHLGHTLSSGPASRLSQGVLMSLFPTMYGQLTAIAREFNFPSTTGLCVYLQISEGGLSMTPRISDETWQILWGHLFEPRSPAPPPLQQFPVCGRIEFDIDLSKARWFDPWVMSSRRPAMDVPISVPPSISHMRADSKTTFLDDQVGDAQSELSYTPMKPRAFTRHVPRKLSLVDRLDSVSVASGLATTVPRGEDGVDAQMRNALTPIVQEDEGKVGSRDLNTRVRSWRAGSSVAPTPLAAVGQISLDPVHMPNTIQLPDTLTVPDGAPEELNLDDFKWSASSLGPPEFYDVESRISSPRVPSVHIDGRLEGSVLLTPTTATSWGPPDDISSVSPTPNLWRLPSPDIAWRMLDDVPLTPSTATSWGPPSEYLDSVSSISRPPSVDIGARMVISRPNTPSTATSWGPPSSWPPTPFGYYELDAPRTPDIAERGQSSPHRYQASYLSFPRFREEAATWEHVWPFNSVASSVHTHVHPSSRAQVEGAWDLVWPFTQPHGLSADLDHHVSDVLDRVYFNTTDSLHAGARVTVALPASYPTFNLYPAIYPHFEIYPGNPCGLQLPQERIRPLYSGREHLLPSSYQPEYPDFNIYPPTRRMVSTEWKRKNLFEPVSLQLPSFYPCLRPYPLVYPHNLSEIYPQILSRQDGSRSAISSSNYQVSTGVASHQSRQADSLTVTLEASYPSFSLYPAVYPAFEIYPVLSTPQEQAASRTISLDVHVNYPLIVLYPSAYPNFDIYPMVPSKSGDCSSTETYHTVEYPFFTLYPAVYPFLDIYPAKTTIQQERHLDISFNPLYPHFDLYPAVYPNFDIYRTGHASNLDTYQKMQPVTIPAGYPAIHIYTPVYPHFEIWPEHRHLAVASSMRRRRRLHAELHEEVLRETPTSGSMDVTGKDTLGVSRRRRRTHAELHAEVIRHGTTLSQTETSTEADRREPSPSAHIPRGTTHLSTSPASRSPSTSPVEAGNPLPPRRARSGTISSRQSSSPTSPAELQSLKTPKSSSPSSPHVRESVSFAPLSSRISAPLRRVSSARPLSVAVPSHSTLSPVDEDPSRVASASTLQRSGSLASQRKSPSRRDSLVLERARLFETMSSHDDAPTRITMSALAQFPTPPVPPVPPLPTDARRLSHSPDLIPTFRR